MSSARIGLIKAAYSVSDAIQLLSVGRTKLYDLVRQGHLKATKCGRKTLFLAQDIAAFLDKLQQGDV
ncbi:MAG TPA: helix-turn-helix domain-containing protein [Patescibacteria group bacterium]|nr:helix-turn-helix domain-containing protein [Patescibacteria group bacterium]